MADNGGPTQTIALLSNSPAIDAGSNALAVDPQGDPLTTDQRGTGYPRIVHGTVDIGAFEFTGTFVVVTAQPPGGVAAGSGFGLSVTAEDSSGNVDTSFDGTVTLALDINPGGSVLGGTLTATARNGVATFADLTLEKAGTGYTIRISSTGVAGTTTNPFEVTPLAATQLVVTAQPPGSVTAGLGFGLTVTAEDQFDNLDTSFGGSATVALLNNPGGATLGGARSVTVQSGVASFSGLTLDLAGAGYTLQITSSGLTSATTDPFNVYLRSVFTVDLTSANGSGAGNAGDLVYVIGLANTNTNPGGSIIQFDPTVFASPQTITLGSILELSETAGPEVIEGPGANLVTVSGNDAVEVFSVVSGVTAFLSGLTISGGSAAQGGGLSVVGATVSLTNVAVINNQAVGADGSSATSRYQPGGHGGDALGGGIYVNGGSLTLNDDTISSNIVRGGAGGAAEAAAGGGGGSADGGGIEVASGNLVLNADVFRSNQAFGGVRGQGAISGEAGGSAAGGGLYVAGGSLVLNADMFESNQAFGGLAVRGDVYLLCPRWRWRIGGRRWHLRGRWKLCSEQRRIRIESSQWWRGRIRRRRWRIGGRRRHRCGWWKLCSEPRRIRIESSHRWQWRLRRPQRRPRWQRRRRRGRGPFRQRRCADSERCLD